MSSLAFVHAAFSQGSDYLGRVRHMALLQSAVWIGAGCYKHATASGVQATFVRVWLRVRTL